MSDGRFVYSTDGRSRSSARDDSAAGVRGASRTAAQQPKPVAGIPNDGVVRIFRERGGRGGKMVTVVRGLPQRGEALATLAAELKKLCGAGGAVKDGAVEVQGDHRERIAERLRSLGHTVKLAGG